MASTETTTHPTRTDESVRFGSIAILLLVIDSVITTSVIALLAETNINLIEVFATSVLSIIGAPVAFGLGFAFPQWVWIFIVAGWITQPMFLLTPIESILDIVIGSCISGLFFVFGLLAGGWTVERAVETFLAISSPFSSGLSMMGSNPFNFTAPELGVVAGGWMLLLFCFSIRELGKS